MIELMQANSKVIGQFNSDNFNLELTGIICYEGVFYTYHDVEIDDDGNEVFLFMEENVYYITEPNLLEKN